MAAQDYPDHWVRSQDPILHQQTERLHKLVLRLRQGGLAPSDELALRLAIEQAAEQAFKAAVSGTRRAQRAATQDAARRFP